MNSARIPARTGKAKKIMMAMFSPKMSQAAVGISAKQPAYPGNPWKYPLQRFVMEVGFLTAPHDGELDKRLMPARPEEIVLTMPDVYRKPNSSGW
jgi:hypothetical protein